MFGFDMVRKGIGVKGFCFGKIALSQARQGYGAFLYCTKHKMMDIYSIIGDGAFTLLWISYPCIS